MKYVKILGLLAVAATALMAFAATASATTATSNGSTYTEGIKAANENGHGKLHKWLDRACETIRQTDRSHHRIRSERDTDIN